MSLRFHEIAETNHRILNPLTAQKLETLGEVCQLRRGQRHLDLACGKAEMLASWASEYQTRGVGVDISPLYLEHARARAAELGVSARLELVEADATAYVSSAPPFDLVSCVGASWVGGGVEGTLDRLKPALAPGGLVLIGEPFWLDPPPASVFAEGDTGARAYGTLLALVRRFEACGMALVEMVLADTDSFDRYVASQWLAVDDYLRAHPTAPEALALAAWSAKGQLNYLSYERRYLGWGVFVLRRRA